MPLRTKEAMLKSTLCALGIFAFVVAGAGGSASAQSQRVVADYARAQGYLDRSRLPAYVSFVEQATARGIERDSQTPQRIFVRISDGAIVKGAPPASGRVIEANNADSDNPFGKRWFFDPRCYVAKSENQTRWNGEAAARFQLQSKCSGENGISELYVDPQTLRPIAADGNITDTDNANMTVALELRYATIGQYTVPSSLSAHAVGHGWLFWARERGEVDYTAYQFYPTAESVRRQSIKP